MAYIRVAKDIPRNKMVKGRVNKVKKRIKEFAVEHPDCRNALETWYRIIKNNSFKSFDELKAYFSSADMVGKLTVFNIGGNKVRLIASIHFNRRKLYVRHVLTHAEYNKGKWKE